MKTWRERIVEAESRRARSFFWRFVPWAFRPWCWPFTREDNEAWLSATTCAAGEVSERYGLDFWRTGDLFNLGLEFGQAMMRGNVRGATRYLDRIEDLALQLKRAQGCSTGS